MTKDVWVRVKGTQTIDGQTDDPIEVIVAGEYYKKNEKHYLFYDEYTDEEGSVTHNKAILSEQYIEITKKGASQARLTFEPGIRHRSNYQTPFGVLLMEFVTGDMKLQENEDELLAMITYELFVNGESHAQCSMELEVRSRNKFQL